MGDVEMILLGAFIEVIIGWIALKQEKPFETHPKTMTVAVTSFVMCWFMLGFKLKFRRIYHAYLRVVPLGIEFFGALSMASLVSLLLPDSVRPLIYVLGLLVLAIHMLFQQLKAVFGQTEFWVNNVAPWFDQNDDDLRVNNVDPWVRENDPAVVELRVMVNREGDMEGPPPLLA